MQITAVAVLSMGMLMGAAFTGKRVAQTPDKQGQAPIVMLLGIAQDGGYPQAGCHKACCSDAWNNPTMKRHVSCLAVIDPQSGERWLIDATPDFREQLYILDSLHPGRNGRMLDGIFLTHAHIGHYTGLVNLGREVAGADHIPVFAMPRMCGFLQNNGPWDQLIKLGNIELKALQTGIALQLNERISIMPFLVPHRQEYSETVGFRITGPSRSVIYLPDIDKWDKWEQDIRQLIEVCDRAFIDGTFYKNGELPGRDMSEIPHPFVEETTALLSKLPEKEKNKVFFIHLNHSNPLLNLHGKAITDLEALGFHIGVEKQAFVF